MFANRKNKNNPLIYRNSKSYGQQRTHHRTTVASVVRTEDEWMPEKSQSIAPVMNGNKMTLPALQAGGGVLKQER